jgi:hypothetical protein
MDTQQLAESKMLNEDGAQQLAESKKPNEDGAQLLPKFKKLIQEEHSFL